MRQKHFPLMRGGESLTSIKRARGTGYSEKYF